MQRCVSCAANRRQCTALVVILVIAAVNGDGSDKPTEGAVAGDISPRLLARVTPNNASQPQYCHVADIVPLPPAAKPLLCGRTMNVL